jgi:nicotinamidase-related amidase/alkylated DNA repair dioxygenase AlkB
MRPPTALLIVGLQRELLTRTSLSSLLAACRAAGDPVVWVRSRYPARSERPPPRWPARPEGERYARAPMNSEHLASGPWGRPYAPDTDGEALLAEGDLQIVKDYYSAFSGTELEARLRARGVQRVLVCGVAADVCVRATAADAFFLGFEVVAVSDCVGATGGGRLREGLGAIERWYGAVRASCELLSEVGAVRAGLGAGDSAVHYGVLPPELAERAFVQVRDEVDWQKMRHRGGLVPRLVALQGELRGELVPIYRHPADEQPSFVPYTPTMQALRQIAEERLGQRFNHALVQRYPDGGSSISAHADKTLDIARGSSVVNLSLGATRTLLLVSKARREDGQHDVQRVELPHGSLFVLGPETNRRFQHAIRSDGRQLGEKRADELRDGGERISLTLRTIATFRQPDGRLVGQGARREDLPARLPEEEALEMLRAFRRENLESDFDWDESYGQGFAVVDLGVVND